MVLERSLTLISELSLYSAGGPSSLVYPIQYMIPFGKFSPGLRVQIQWAIHSDDNLI